MRALLVGGPLNGQTLEVGDPPPPSIVVPIDLEIRGRPRSGWMRARYVLSDESEDLPTYVHEPGEV